jgi:hypothetical protein
MSAILLFWSVSRFYGPRASSSSLISLIFLDFALGVSLEALASFDAETMVKRTHSANYMYLDAYAAAHLKRPNLRSVLSQTLPQH